MSSYLEEAKRLRTITQVHYNCAQAVLIPFAKELGFSEEQMYRISANFGAGMRMGATCGAVTGGLMALGLLGLDQPADANAFCRKVREAHDGLIDCKDLLRVNARQGKEKKLHCDEMVYECVRLVEQMMKEKEGSLTAGEVMDSNEKGAAAGRE